MQSPEKYQGGANPLLALAAEVINNRGSGRIEIKGMASQTAPSFFSFSISPDGAVSGGGQFVGHDGTSLKLGISGRAAGNSIILNFSGFSRPANVTLSRVPR
jgi:hypothetical protein